MAEGIIAGGMKDPEVMETVNKSPPPMDMVELLDSYIRMVG